MAERRRNKKRKDEAPGVKPPVDKPSKEEYAVAKWIRENVPSKKTKFVSHNVEYFTGSRAVNALLDKSPWNKTIFETREQVVDFLDVMLRHKFFHRAKKIALTEEELNKRRANKKKARDCCVKEKGKDCCGKDKEKDKDKEKEKDKEQEKEKDKDKEKEKEKEKETVEEKEDDNKEKEPKKGAKVRLEMHMEQYFVDCNDAYVWIYEPIPVYYWFFGTLVVLGAIAVCLFPLWPLTIRNGVYYLSVAAAGFFVFILALALLRVVLFCFLWVLTLGRHHFWLLPNLAEDVGFFASFWPLYQYEYCGPGSDKKKKKKRRKEKDSDGEEGTSNQGSDEKALLNEDAQDQECEKEEDASGEEGSESEKSNTGKDFEMVQHNELEDK